MESSERMCRVRREDGQGQTLWPAITLVWAKRLTRNGQESRRHTKREACPRTESREFQAEECPQYKSLRQVKSSEIW